MDTTCIMCPMGCALHIEKDQNGEVIVTGNSCRRGLIYGQKEFVSPERVVTSLVKREGGGVVSVKTSKSVSKAKIAEVLDAVKHITAKQVCRIGDVLLENAAESGADIVVTQNVG